MVFTKIVKPRVNDYLLMQNGEKLLLQNEESIILNTSKSGWRKVAKT